MPHKEKISVIIPLYNEEWNIIPLFSEIQEVLVSDFKWHDYEIILVNDWSTDKTWENLKRIKEDNQWTIIVITLQRNYGQSIALEAWFKNCLWDIVVTLDGDWQNDPKDIKRLYDNLNNEWLDVVAWWRESRKDSFVVKVITKCARFFRNLFINDKIHDSGCTLRIYRKECIEDIHLWGEMHRYIAEILTIKWYKVWEIQVHHRKRVHWTSKYTWKKSIKWFIDLIYIRFIAKYQSRPLHLFWWIWLLTFFVWLISFFFSIYQKILWWLSINRSWYFLVWVFLIQTGIMIFIFWIIIDILIRIYHNGWTEKRYKIKGIIK